MTRIDPLLGIEGWRAYERAMFNDLYYQFRGPEYVVKPNVQDLIGKLSLTKRQVDVIVYERENPDRPLLMVECKRYNRKLDVNDVGEFSSRAEDVAAAHAMLVCPKGFSSAGRNFAKAKGIWLYVLELQEAERLNWREIARALYPWDEIYHLKMGDALYTAERSVDVEDWIDALEGIAFEEWEATLIGLHSISPGKCARLLRAIAQSHYDDGWRFNAIRLLIEWNYFDAALCNVLIEHETDPEILMLLEDAH